MSDAAHVVAGGERGRGPWVLTVSGRRIRVLDPAPGDVTVEDIAHGLALMPRFGGQTVAPYSVAQHSVLVADIVDGLAPGCGVVVLQRALLHDAAEGLGLCDLPTPVKAVLPAYRALEERVMAAICERFALPLVVPAVVKEADRIAFATERRDLFPRRERRLQGVVAPDARRLCAWSWRKARRVFLARWRGLVARRVAGAP